MMTFENPPWVQHLMEQADAMHQTAMEESNCLTLGELISSLREVPGTYPVFAITPPNGAYEAYDDEKHEQLPEQGDKLVVYVRDSVHSYRGYYSDLAIDYDIDENPPHQCTVENPPHQCTVEELIRALQDANGRTFEGWKGGDFFMSLDTSVWLAQPGNSGGMMITSVQQDDTTGNALIITERELW